MPFKIFGQPQHAPQFDDEYDRMDLDCRSPDAAAAPDHCESSGRDSDSASDDDRLDGGAMRPSERLRTLPEAKAELVDANAYTITVKVTPSSHEVTLRGRSDRLARLRRKRDRKHRPDGYYPKRYKLVSPAEARDHPSDSEHEFPSSSVSFRPDAHNKRMK